MRDIKHLALVSLSRSICGRRRSVRTQVNQHGSSDAWIGHINVSQVQGTNDSSIVSKCSMAAQGYFKDDFLKLFVSSPKNRRAPLINRGYYIRAMIIDDVLKTFLAQFSNMEKQVISLGAGFDSAYFRLHSSGHLDKTTFIEVDFPQVSKRKTALIQAHDELKKCLKEEKQTDERNRFGCKDLFLASEGYYLLGTDLCDLERLEEGLEFCQVDMTKPTLLLSECVITYMEAKNSNDLIQWALKTFSNAVFTSYEQIQPDDAFGIVMQNHFRKLNSPIKAIQLYPTLEAQCHRYTAMGWPHCAAVNMNQYYFNALLQEERKRIDALEMFDEFEEWHLKCAHYMVVCASTGEPKDILSKLGQIQDASRNAHTSCNNATQKLVDDVVTLKPCSTNVTLIKRFGHASASGSRDSVLICGGFGETSNGKHVRLTDVLLMDLSQEICCVIQPYPECTTLGARLHHTINAISSSKLIIYGGRTSPAKPCHSTVLLSIENTNHGLVYNVKEIAVKGSVPTPRWRHCAVLSSSNERLIVNGGCTTGGSVIGDTWCLDISKAVWFKVELSGVNPGPRHSHTTSMWKDNKFILAGGIDGDLRPVTSMYIVDGDSWECSQLSLMPDLKLERYSHTCHISGDTMIVLGGVNPLSSVQPPVTVINLSENTWIQYKTPAADPEHPIMLHNHTSVQMSDSRILILGGGGNCFSFGTHLNNSPIELTLDISR